MTIATRKCGDCQLCCKLVPVETLNKRAGQRCRFQSFAKGCKVYASRPECCRLWDCMWLRGEPGDGLNRPDRVHYVIDILPDFITLRDNETGERTDIGVVQVWVDPAYPDAHRDPGLRAWLDGRKEIAIVRYNGSDAFTLWPPSRVTDGRWHEQGGTDVLEERTSAERYKKLRALGYEFSAVIEV